MLPKKKLNPKKLLKFGRFKYRPSTTFSFLEKVVLDKISMLSEIKQQIKDLLQQAGIETKSDLVYPPKSEMGDLALPCFELAKKLGKNPVDAAKELAEKCKMQNAKCKIIDRVESAGPYVNFFLNAKVLAELVLKEANQPSPRLRRGKKIMIEFSQPNTHKLFHIGHLRGTITGESIARLLENSGAEVVRANYQGDVGMHIAKCLWFLLSQKFKVKSLKSTNIIDEKVRFLGEAYTAGAKAFDESEKAKAEITAINEKIYLGEDIEIKELYQETRAWSLEYFDGIYKRLGTRFDRFYFESEMFRPAEEIIREALRQEILKQSQGAVIFEGSKHGLHDRVFLNTMGFPTYEGKDLALATKQFSDYHPGKIVHVVGKEQTDYFKVLFQALAKILPESQGKEEHLSYGWVSLKSGKMSSREGKVVLGEWLLDEVKNKVLDIMKESDINNKENTAEKLAQAAVKYSFLKTGIKNDIVFDLEESISLAGDSGPYVLYIVARINSILRKASIFNFQFSIFNFVPASVNDYEKRLLLKIAEYSQVAQKAASELDPSKMAQYLFDLAQAFNVFYHECPVLQAKGREKKFRLKLIKAVAEIMSGGLYLLGIETVEEM